MTSYLTEYAVVKALRPLFAYAERRPFTVDLLAHFEAVFAVSLCPGVDDGPFLQQVKCHQWADFSWRLSAKLRNPATCEDLGLWYIVPDERIGYVTFVPLEAPPLEL